MFESGGWFYPVLISVALIVVLAGMEILSVAIADKLAPRKPVNAALTGKGPARAA